jgi:hypothetical protein
MQAIGGLTHIVLPCNEEQFALESVVTSGGDWTDRFKNVIDNADEVVVASDQRLRFGSVGYDYSNELLYGLATVRASELDTELARIAVWDGAPGDGAGGTADIVTLWQAGGHAVSSCLAGCIPYRAQPALRSVRQKPARKTLIRKFAP